jgi:hypothetical protein
MHDPGTYDPDIDRRPDAVADPESDASGEGRIVEWASEGDHARALVRRLWEGDPLQLSRRCARRLAQRALLLEAARVERRARARIALTATLETARADSARGEGTRWVAEGVDAAIDDLLRADERGAAREAVARRAPEADDDLPAAVLCGTLGIEPASLPRACATFNGLPEPTRRAFFAAVVEGESIASCAQAATTTNGTDPQVVIRRRLVEAFSALAFSAPGALADANGPGSDASRAGSPLPPREETRS